MAGRKRKISVKRIVIAVIIALAVIVYLVIKAVMGMQGKVVLVNTEKVKREELVSTLNTSGTIASEDEKCYVSAVNAKVAQIHVKVGDSVKAGDYLLTYDTASLENNYTAADLQAKASEATVNDSLNKSAEAEKAKSDAEARINDLKAQINAREAEVNGLSDAVRNAAVQTNNNEQELGDLQQRMEGLLARQAQEALSPEEQGELGSIQGRVNEINAQNHELANNNLQNQSELEKKQQELAKLQSDLATAEGEKSAADAVILSANAKAHLDYTSQEAKLTVSQAEDNLTTAKAGILAEFDGIVTAVSAVEGCAAAEGQELLRVADATKMQVEFQISKYNMEQVKKGQEVKIDFLGHKYHGSVTNISKAAVAGKNGPAMVDAAVSIEDPDDNLILGLDAKMKITVAKVSNALTVPLTAVNTDRKGDFVYVIEKGKVKSKDVKVGISSEDRIQIVSGIKEGEEIITTVDGKVKEGVAAAKMPDLGEVQTKDQK